MGLLQKSIGITKVCCKRLWFKQKIDKKLSDPALLQMFHPFQAKTMYLDMFWLDLNLDDRSRGRSGWPPLPSRKYILFCPFSATSTTTILHPTGGLLRGHVRLRPQLDLRRRGEPYALRQVAQRESGCVAGGNAPYREERASADGNPGERQLHLRRSLQARHHWKVDSRPGSRWAPRWDRRAITILINYETPITMKAHLIDTNW